MENPLLIRSCLKLFPAISVMQVGEMVFIETESTFVGRVFISFYLLALAVYGLAKIF